MEQSGTLSVVATPIGNLEDVTLRALRTLQEVDYILCEDTRVTSKLCTAHDITTPLKRYDAHTSDAVHEQVLAELRSGAQVALVSDAGTPGISDPGVRLVDRARAEGVTIEAVPGASAVTAAVSIAGLKGNQFTFLGYAPQKKGRQTFFATLAEYSYPVLFFESTHRIVKTLDALAAALPTAPILLLKELTKLHEAVFTGTAAEIAEQLRDTPTKQKGEFVIIVRPAAE
jgi:16S rRNA (cytidine1402-2'-O)-methyltransferase